MSLSATKCGLIAHVVGHATMQLQEEYLIPPDEVRRLQTGEVFLIANGQSQKARIAPLAISSEQRAAAYAFLASEEAAGNPTTYARATKRSG